MASKVKVRITSCAVIFFQANESPRHAGCHAFAAKPAGSDEPVVTAAKACITVEATGGPLSIAVAHRYCREAGRYYLTAWPSSHAFAAASNGIPRQTDSAAKAWHRALRQGGQILMDTRAAVVIEQAHVHGPCVQIDAAIELVVLFVKAHHGLLGWGA